MLVNAGRLIMVIGPVDSVDTFPFVDFRLLDRLNRRAMAWNQIGLFGVHNW